MPIRIYALAKELKIDSKELVEVCKKAGLTNKGSALASLADDEVAKVKDYLSGGKKKKPPVASKPSAPAPVAPIPKQPAPSTPTPSTTGVFSRDDYVAPAGTAGSKPKVLGGSKPKPKPKPTAGDSNEAASDKPVKSRPPTKREPVVKLAAIPQAEQPSESTTSNPNEPAPQKPIMTLPKDAIRGAIDGSSAPLQQFTTKHDRKRAQDRMQPPEEKAAPPAAEPTGKPRRGRGKKDNEKEQFDSGSTKPKSGLAGMASARAERNRGRRQGAPIRRRTSRLTRKGTNTAAPRKGSVVVELPCTIRSFSEAVGVPAVGILRTLMGMGISVQNINTELDVDLAEMIAEEAGVAIDFRHPESLEDRLILQLEDKVDDPADLVPRPPIVTFLGHVDHGKTSLLDYLIGINVVSGEAGGITQHIRAYSIEKDGRRISFVDTPGHEAFTEMRARGANVTDIAVLVVAADDGVMPQTEEAISHARAAEVPIIVAMNKIDLPGVDENKTLQDLSTHELLPTEWGGDVEVVKTSATQGTGMDELLETLLITADLHEYKANPSRPADGTCLEAQQEAGRGVVAKLIVQNGTLRVGDVVVCGPAHGRVKALYDTLRPDQTLEEAGPSIPVNVTGLDVAPGAGDRFHVLDEIGQAREIAATREHASRTQSLTGRGTMRVSFDEFQRRLEEGRLGSEEDLITLNIILRADVRGSIEAIQKEMSKLDHPEFEIKFLQASVGGVTVADVTLADASNAVIIGFNVIPDEAARSLADERGVEIRRYNIIYKVTEDIKSMLEGKLKPDEEVVELGRALVQRTFVISRVGTIAGCRVLAGTVQRNCRIRVNRDGRGIGDYALESLKREKDDSKEVREGFECGIKLSGFNDLKEGDILEAYKIEEVARTL